MFNIVIAAVAIFMAAAILAEPQQPCPPPTDRLITCRTAGDET